MESETFDIDKLLARILAHRAGRDELIYFSEWMRKEENRMHFEKFRKIWNLTSGSHLPPGTLEAGLGQYTRFMEKSLRNERRFRMLKRSLSAAAVMILAATSFLWLNNQQDIREEHTRLTVPERGVQLILADGRKLNFSDSSDIFRMRAGTEGVEEVSCEEMIYSATDILSGTEDREPIYNEIIVPAGKRFRMQLPDGTKVWINSESSLRYPKRFTGKLRMVEVRGNVYFEVQKDTLRPFVVKTPEIYTEVLGTCFEVNVYGDGDKVSATLLEGSVRVEAGTHSGILKPGQQFLFHTKSRKTEVLQVDALNCVRWKEGILVIGQENFDALIWKLERWYGVRIENKTGKIFNQTFSGEFEREDVYTAVRTMCLNLGISCRIRGDRIVLEK